MEKPDALRLLARQQGQIMALSASLAALIGMLRAIDALQPDDVGQLFQLADENLPTTAEPSGPETLALLREISGRVASRAPEDP